MISPGFVRRSPDWAKSAEQTTPRAEYYQYEAESVRERDLQILTTANHFHDTPGNYRRFAGVMDRRLLEWQARAANAE